MSSPAERAMLILELIFYGVCLAILHTRCLGLSSYICPILCLAITELRVTVLTKKLRTFVAMRTVNFNHG